MPAARATARAPGYVGDSTKSGAPGGTKARKAAVIAPCPPGVIRTSRASRSGAVFCANHERRPSNPALGGRSQASGIRDARAKAAPSARMGMSDAWG